MNRAVSAFQLATPVSSQAAQFVASLDDASIPTEVVQKARTCILYGFGIGLLCLKQETARVAEQSVLAIDGKAGSRGSTSLAGGHQVSVSAAVFANAIMLHSRCQEDTSGTAHLGVIVLSVALAHSFKSQTLGLFPQPFQASGLGFYASLALEDRR